MPNAKSCFLPTTTVPQEGLFTIQEAHDNPTPPVSSGDLACPCKDCPAFFSLRTLRQFLQDEVFEVYKSYLGRKAVAKSQAEQTLALKTKQASQQQRTPLQLLVSAIQEACSAGVSLKCPDCGLVSQKDDECLHMTCPDCLCAWCYACGRDQDDCGDSCDYISAYLQDNPGYDQCCLFQESPGTGARHEFHKRRIMYFLKRLQESLPVELWEQLVQNHPNLLDKVPTQGRRIEWEEIPGAPLPVVGRTHFTQVTWRNEMDSTIRDLRDALGLPALLLPPPPPVGLLSLEPDDAPTALLPLLQRQQEEEAFLRAYERTTQDILQLAWTIHPGRVQEFFRQESRETHYPYRPTREIERPPPGRVPLCPECGSGTLGPWMAHTQGPTLSPWVYDAGYSLLNSTTTTLPRRPEGPLAPVLSSYESNRTRVIEMPWTSTCFECSETTATGG